MSTPPRRSRFDKDESDRPRSRFDTGRRSRSPSSREPESRRTRSPVGRGASDSPAQADRKASAAAAAAAAAARINAQIQAKKGIQHVEVPPIRSASASTPPQPKTPNLDAGETYQQNGDYIKDIEINDLRNRYMLTNGAAQKRIKDETGADVTTRGEYYPDKNMATAANPPLYLRVTSTTKAGLDAAVKAIEELKKQDLPNLVDERRFRRREPENFERDEYGRRKWPEEKLPVDLEPINGFNLRAQVVGRGGDNVKYIQAETSCKVQIKGRGSGFVESATGRESEEPMYLHIAGPRPEGVEQAKNLCEQLLEKVRSDYHTFKENQAQNRFNGGGDRYGGGGERYGGGDRYGGGERYANGRPGYDRDRSQSYGHGGYGSQPDSYQSPAVAADGSSSAADYNAQWAAFYSQQSQQDQQGLQVQAGQDPYAQYGGYEAYMRWYSYFYPQAGSQQSPPPGAASAYAAPPPPPSEPAPPGTAPPPPPSASPPGYHAVPPPPGL